MSTKVFIPRGIGLPLPIVKRSLAIIGVVVLWGGAFVDDVAHAYTSYTSPYKITVSQSVGTARWDFVINGPDGSSPGRLSCGTTYCAVGFMTRTGLGQGWGPLCDSGGVCLITDSNMGMVSVVKVQNGVTWDVAYETFIKKYGRSGSGFNTSTAFNPQNAVYSHVAWGVLCTGFAVLPFGKIGVSTLAPGAMCGTFTPPDLSCSYSLPELLDFGIVPMGGTPLPVSDSGSYQCATEGTVKASIGKTPTLGGSPLKLYLNNVLLTPAGSDITHGVSGVLTLRGEIVEPLTVAGEYSESVPVVLSFY